MVVLSRRLLFLLQPNACTAAVLGDELDAGVFKRPPDGHQIGRDWGAVALLKIHNGAQTNAALFGEVFLSEANEGPRSAALSGRNRHARHHTWLRKKRKGA